MLNFNSRAVLLVLVLGVIPACVAVNDRKVDPSAVASVNLSLASTYYSKGQFAFAEEKLGKAIQAEPNNVSANALLALVYDQQAKTQRAQNQFEKSLELAGENSVEFAEINNNFAIFLCKNGKWNEAESHFLLAVGVTEYKTPEVALENAALCAFKLQEFGKSAKYYQRALSHNRQLVSSILGLARVKAHDQDWPVVQILMQDYHSISTATEESLFYSILAEIKLHNKSEEERFIGQLKSTFPNSTYLKKLDAERM